MNFKNLRARFSNYPIIWIDFSCRRSKVLSSPPAVKVLIKLNWGVRGIRVKKGFGCPNGDRTQSLALKTIEWIAGCCFKGKYNRHCVPQSGSPPAAASSKTLKIKRQRIPPFCPHQKLNQGAKDKSWMVWRDGIYTISPKNPKKQHLRQSSVKS